MFSLDEYQAVREGAGLLDRRARGRLRLTGSDRRSYLQGLLTNDIAALTPGRGCYAALLTPQGRMISDMRVSELGPLLLIDLPGGTAARVRQHLSDFIFSEDVEVSDIQGSMAQFGLYGPRAAGMVQTVTDAAELPGQLDTNTMSSFAGGDLIVVRSDDYGEPGFDLFVAADRADELARSLSAQGAVDVSAETVDVCRIEAGRPEFGVDMDEHTIPLEAGIEDRAISLTKGCYVGQEVIIRVLHRGHGRVARRLVGLLGDGDRVFGRGARLLTSDGAKEAGVVTSAARSPRLGRPIGLGYVHRDYVEPGTALVAGTAEQRQGVTVGRTPFSGSAAG